MNENKRVKLTHGTATVGKNCSEKTLKALDRLSKLAYEMESKPLNIDNVSNQRELLIAFCKWSDAQDEQGFKLNNKDIDNFLSNL